MISLLVEPGSLAPGKDLRLAEAERHHLKVRRAREGETVRLMDAHGMIGSGALVQATAGIVRVADVASAPRPPVRGLVVAAGDRDRFAWLVEKAAELGVTDVVPLETERTSDVSSRVRGQHIDRLQRRAFEAIKQSGAAWAPVIHLPHSLAELVSRERTGTRWLADREGAAPGPVPPAAEAWTAIGPEGGFTEAERRLLRDAGWVPVRLGSCTLRFETAALAAAVLMSSRDS